MLRDTPRDLCWVPRWNADYPEIGLEHVVVTPDGATSVLMGIDTDGSPFHLTYQLRWDGASRLRLAELTTHVRGERHGLVLRADGEGHWTNQHHEPLPHLDGCIDIDIWPTPLTNTLPIWRSALPVGARREYRMAWVSAPTLVVEPKAQAYTRLEERVYRFESLDGTGFTADLIVDDSGFVDDYPGLFRRVIVADRG